MFDEFFWLFPAAIIGAAVFLFRRTRALVEERLRKVARRRGGRLAPAPWILYPRLVLELGRSDMQVSAMYGGGRSNGSGQFFTWVGSDRYPAADFDVRRMPARVGRLERIGWTRADTRDSAFDAVFWMRKEHTDTARAVLSDEVRMALLALDEKLGVRVRIGRAPAYRDGTMVHGEHEPRLTASIRGLPPEVGDIERLVDLTALVHERLTAQRLEASPTEPASVRL